MKKNPHNIQIRTYYRKYRNLLCKLLKVAKKRYYTNKLNSANNNQKWQVINEILNKTTNNIPQKLVNADDNILTNNTDIAEEVVAFFTNIGPNLADNITNNGDHNKYLNRCQSKSFFFHSVSEHDVFTGINHLDSIKSVGYDLIHSKLVIQSSFIISAPLAHIINCSFIKGIFPDQLKIARITPVFKRGSSTYVGNNRPISILLVISKIFETIVGKQITNYLEKYEILQKFQYGFRKKHNTKLALADLVKDIVTNLDNGYITIGIFIDLKKHLIPLTIAY
uniref:RNA-directed DNA polymerase from mobile element jockey-like n=1 Tax=Saccoglossus kowalevskii TaxID=10224 RepID=A0ABM0MYN3_SACKO|nr:PREDICTED: RNA-directed DNA polymerase from mobile element jockey-like [Saccoglossus kowalevskii]